MKSSVWQKVLILVKKSPSSKFYIQSVQNISNFNKEKVFIITNKRKLEDETFYWLKNTKNQ